MKFFRSIASQEILPYGVILHFLLIFIPFRVYIQDLDVYLYPIGQYFDVMTDLFEESSLGDFVRARRKSMKLTQIGLADKAGVGIRFLRELENDKPSLQLDKVNQVLVLFGYVLGPVPINRSRLINETR